MSAPQAVSGATKRKGSSGALNKSDTSKKRRRAASQSQQPALLGPHEAIIGQLESKHNLLTASVISSSKIHKRVVQATSHLIDKTSSSPNKLPLVLLHARTADVCKMITIVEQCKRVLADESKDWYQYNQLFDLPVDSKRDQDVIDETTLGKDGEDSDDGEFEVMASRFEKAVLPPPTTRAVKSLRIFLSVQPIPELQTRDGVTVQSSEK